MLIWTGNKGDICPPLKSQKCHTPCCKRKSSHCDLMVSIVMLSCPLWYKGVYYDEWPFVCVLAYWLFYERISLFFLSLDRMKYNHYKPAQKNNTNTTNTNEFWRNIYFHKDLFFLYSRSHEMKSLITHFIFSNGAIKFPR